MILASALLLVIGVVNLAAGVGSLILTDLLVWGWVMTILGAAQLLAAARIWTFGQRPGADTGRRA